MKNFGNSDHTVDCDNLDAFFEEVQGNRDAHDALMIGLSGLGNLPREDEEDAMLEQIEPSSEEAADVPGPRVERTYDWRPVRMVRFNGGKWFTVPNRRWFVVEEPAERVMTNDVMVVQPRARVILHEGPIAAEYFHPGMLSTVPARTPKPVPAAPQKTIRRCSHPGCRTDFLVLPSAPNADMCQKHHQERVRARKEAERAEQVRLSTLVDAQKAREKDERTIREAVRTEAALPEGAVITSREHAGQTIVVWRQKSFTVSVQVSHGYWRRNARPVNLDHQLEQTQAVA